MCLAVNMGVEDPLTHWPISSAPRGTVFNQGRGGGGKPHPKELFGKQRSETEGVQTETKCWFVLNTPKTGRGL